MYDELWDEEVRQGKIFGLLEPIEGSRKIVGQLVEKHEVHLITSRPEKAHQVTRDWLAKNGIRYTSLQMAHDFNDKIQKMCMYDIVIEDELEVARVIESKGVPVILFDYPWNRIGQRIKRVKDWQEAVEQIELASPD